MLRRVLWLLAGLVALLGAGVLFIYFTDPINPATFERIQVGMTLEEVQAVLGKPPGYYRTDREPFPKGFPTRALKPIYPGTPKFWVGNSYEIIVWFNEEGRA